MKAKKTILLAFLMAGTLLAKAQNDLAIATLQHGDEVSVFKGTGALASALAAASDNDVITLSQGTFIAAAVTKSVSIYGAGFEDDAATGTHKTIISGDLTIGISGETCSNIHLEGLRLNNKLILGVSSSNNTLTLSNLTVVKVLTNGRVDIIGETDDIFFDQCVILNGISPERGKKAANLRLTNCYYYGGLHNYNAAGTIVSLDHCLFVASDSDPFSYTNIPITMTNSVFLLSWSLYFFPTGSDVRYCLSNLDHIADPGRNYNSETCYYVSDSSTFFKNADENSTYTSASTFELANSEWIGDDGTEIGIHGGNGWSKVPSTPVVKSLSVTPSGTNLNVTYEAEVR